MSDTAPNPNPPPFSTFAALVCIAIGALMMLSGLLILESITYHTRPPAPRSSGWRLQQ